MIIKKLIELIKKMFGKRPSNKRNRDLSDGLNENVLQNSGKIQLANSDSEIRRIHKNESIENVQYVERGADQTITENEVAVNHKKIEDSDVDIDDEINIDEDEGVDEDEDVDTENDENVDEAAFSLGTDIIANSASRNIKIEKISTNSDIGDDERGLEIDYAKVAERMQLLRISQGINQIEVAKGLDSTVAYVSNIENNRTKLNIRVLAYYADMCHVSVEYLLNAGRKYQNEQEMSELEVQIIRALSFYSLEEKQMIFKILKIWKDFD